MMGWAAVSDKDDLQVLVERAGITIRGACREVSPLRGFGFFLLPVPGVDTPG